MASYASLFEDGQRRMREALSEQGLAHDLIKKAVESGYIYTSMGDRFRGTSQPGVKDTYYGSKPSGLIDLNSFCNLLQAVEPPPPHGGPPHYHVSSLAEAKRILSGEDHARWLSKMSFRGQTKEYVLRRAVPNPLAARPDGSEPMILPSVWRRFCGVDPARRWVADSRSKFVQPLYAEPLVFPDIPNWAEHLRNTGISPHDYPDSFPDDMSEKIWRRYNTHFIQGPFFNEVPLMEQHYGMETIGLDVTFDLATAFFFATHGFVSGSCQGATYERIGPGDESGVVYCFVFQSPSITRTHDLLDRRGLFKHLDPSRPRLQQCALPAYHGDEIGAAARDLHAVFHISTDFSEDGLPTAQHLFPNRRADRFYDALLRLKAQHPDLWSRIVEYAWA